jgi:hypothetical protein
LPNRDYHRVLPLRGNGVFDGVEMVKAEKIKVPILKLQWGVLYRIWQSDRYNPPRLCSFDSLMATFTKKEEAEEYAHERQKESINPNNEFYVVEIGKLKAAGLPERSVPEGSTITGQVCHHIAPAETAEQASAGTGADN